MNPTLALRKLGQSLWLDNITRTLLNSGTLARYIADLSVTGLTSNPTIFEQAIGSGDSYDASIRVLKAAGLSDEDLFFELALEDLTQAADLFRPVHDATEGVDGWVSLEVSPLLADNAAHTIQAANRLSRKAERANLFIKIPGTPEGVRAVEEVIFDGVPVNVTLLFSREQYVATAEAYMRGIERRLAAGRVGPLEAARRCGRAASALAVGEHRYQGPGGAGHPLRPGTCRSRDDQHLAGEDAARVRRSRQGRTRVAR